MNDIEKTVLRQDEFGRLLVVEEERTIPVRVQLCFPWTEPVRFFSLRDVEDKEIRFIEDPTLLDAPSRQALLLAALQTRFLFEVKQVMEVKQEHELRLWQVQTEQGFRRFQTKLDDWPRMVGKDAWLVRDVGGDLYLLWQLSAMDARSKVLLSAYIDIDPV